MNANLLTEGKAQLFMFRLLACISIEFQQQWRIDIQGNSDTMNNISGSVRNVI